LRQPLTDRLSDIATPNFSKQWSLGLSHGHYWRNLYQANGVFEVIYQQRRTIVLDLVDGLGLASRSHILEIVCGAGLTTIALAQRGYTVQAVDAVDRMLVLTRQAAAETGVADRVMTSLGDAHALAFPDGAFSLVIGMGVAPWLHSLNTAIREFARVLRPGGYLILTADNRWRLNHVLDPLFFPRSAYQDGVFARCSRGSSF
jgi:ubiquinone/menaquinone biosynthesis C-methylase UbiE